MDNDFSHAGVENSNNGTTVTQAGTSARTNGNNPSGTNAFAPDPVLEQLFHTFDQKVWSYHTSQKDMDEAWGLCISEYLWVLPACKNGEVLAPKRPGFCAKGKTGDPVHCVILPGGVIDCSCGELHCIHHQWLKTKIQEGKLTSPLLNAEISQGSPLVCGPFALQRRKWFVSIQEPLRNRGGVPRRQLCAITYVFPSQLPFDNSAPFPNNRHASTCLDYFFLLFNEWMLA